VNEILAIAACAGKHALFGFDPREAEVPQLAGHPLDRLLMQPRITDHAAFAHLPASHFELPLGEHQNIGAVPEQRGNDRKNQGGGDE